MYVKVSPANYGIRRHFNFPRLLDVGPTCGNNNNNKIIIRWYKGSNLETTMIRLRHYMRHITCGDVRKLRIRLFKN